MRHTLAFVLATAACAADAARPLQTEDAPVLDARDCELEAARTELLADGPGTRRHAVQLGCGVGAHSELALQGLTPRELVLGGKTRLAVLAGPRGDVALSVAWSLSHRRTDGDWQRSSAGALVVASAPLGRDWRVHANLGHLRDEALRRRSMTWALALEHTGLGDGGRWQPVAEVFGDDRGERWANAGVRFAVVREQLCVDASLGRRLGGGTRLASVGAVLAF